MGEIIGDIIGASFIVFGPFALPWIYFLLTGEYMQF